MPKVRFNRLFNARRNMVFGLFNKIISLVIAFLTRTIIIRVLGAEYLGLSGLFSSILQVLNLTELGFGSAIVFSMYEPIARNDNEELCALLNLYKKIYSVIGIMILVGGGAVMPFLPYLIKGSWPADINIYLLFGIYLLDAGISYFLFAYMNSLLSAYQRDDLVSKVHLAVSVFTSALQLTALFVSKNYYLYAAIMVLSSVIMNLTAYHLSRKIFPDITCRGKLSEEKMKDITVRVKGLMIQKFCMISRNAFDSIFVSSFIGLVDTAKYNNYYYIISAISGIMNILGQAIKAGVGNSIVTESREKNHADMEKLNFIYMWIVAWLFTCLICLYQPFMELIYGKDMLFPFSIAILFALYFYVLKMGDIRAVYVEAIGMWWENRYRAIAEVAANLLLNYFLGKNYGVIGIVAATLVSLLVFNFFWGSTIIYRYYYVGISALIYYKQHALYAAVGFLTAGITFGVCSLVSSGGFTGFFLKGLICFALPNLILLVCYGRTKQFEAGKEVLGRAFHATDSVSSETNGGSSLSLTGKKKLENDNIH